MRAASCWLLIGMLGTGLASVTQADEGEGLSLPRLQGRVTLGMGVETALGDPYGSGAGAKFGGASVLGDYYFGRHVTREGDSSGFRATSGVFLGSQLGSWGGPAAVPNAALISVERHSFSLLTPPRATETASPDASPVPYVGLGYSGGSLKGGWGFSADFGLMALNPGGATRLGRALGSGQNVEDALREMRMSPLVQLGASYSF